MSAEADGLSVAVTEDGETVAAVGIMGDPREVDRRKEELIAVLARHRAAWGARRAVAESGGAAGSG